MTTQTIDEIIRTLNAERRTLPYNEEQRVQQIIKELQTLKDTLLKAQTQPMKHRDLAVVLEQRPELDSAWSNPYEFLDPDTQRRAAMNDQARKAAEKKFEAAKDKGDIPKDAAFSWTPTDPLGDKARDHRRQMHEGVIEAIRKIETDLKDSLKENRENFKERYQRIHRETKIDGLVLVWNLRKRSSKVDAISADEKAWIKEQLREKPSSPPPPQPDGERQKVLKKEIDATTAARNVIQELEILRKNLIVVREVLLIAEKTSALHPQERQFTYGDLLPLLDEIYPAVMDTAIEEHGLHTGILNYTTNVKLVKKPIAIAWRQPTVDYVHHPPSKADGFEYYEITDGKGRVQQRKKEDVKVFKDQSKKFARSHFLRNPKDGLKSCRLQLRKLIKFQGYRNNPTSALLSPTDLQEMLKKVESPIGEARRIIYDLQRTKFDRDHPNRFSNEIRTLGKAAEKVADQVAVWEDAVTFLVEKYNMLQTLGDLEEPDRKTTLVDIVGTFLRSNLFATAQKEELYTELCRCFKLRGGLRPTPEDHLINTYGADAQQRTVWARWFLCQSHWTCWGTDPPEDLYVDAMEELIAWLRWRDEQAAAFQKQIGSIPLKQFDTLRTMALMMAEQEQIELAFLIEYARADLSVRDEIDWVAFARAIEDIIRKAGGAVIYVKSLDKAYKVIRAIVGKTLGNLNKNDYPRLGSATVSVSVALNVGQDVSDYAKLSGGLTATFSGVLSQDDDRRVRFRGSFSLGLSGGAEIGTNPSEQHYGSDDEEHFYTQVAWVSAKAKLGASKGLFSAYRVWVYNDHEHLAASWAHSLALAYTYAHKPIRWIQHIGNRVEGIEVLNPRAAKEDDQEILKIVAGTEYEKVLGYVQRPVLNAHAWWQGLTHWGDLQVSADLSGSYGPFSANLHAENLVHIDNTATFWKDVYEGGRHHQENWSPRTGASDMERTTKRADVLTSTWSKVYPPLGSIGQAVTLSQSTPSETAGESPVTTDLVGVEGGVDAGLNVDLGFTYIENHPNFDNDGMYLNVKVGRKMHAKVDLQVVSFEANKTIGKPINRREIRLFFHRLRGLARRITRAAQLSAGNKREAAAVKDSTMGQDTRLGGLNPKKGVHWKLMRYYYRDLRNLAKYGTFELNFVYSKQGWALQYGRVWRSFDFTLAGKAQAGELPLSLEISGSLERNMSPFEVPGDDTLTYVQTVYDGLYLRDPRKGKENAYWLAYKDVHRRELLALCRRIGLDEQGHESNAYLEVKADADVGSANLKQAAAGLIRACKVVSTSHVYFPDDQQPIRKGKASDEGSRQGDKQAAQVHARRHGRTRLRAAAACSAHGVVLMNDITGEVSTNWPSGTGRLPGKADRAPNACYFANPADDLQVVYLLENIEDIRSVTLEIFSHKNPKNALWSTTCEPDKAKPPEADAQEADAQEADAQEAQPKQSATPSSNGAGQDGEDEDVVEEVRRVTTYKFAPAEQATDGRKRHGDICAFAWSTDDENPFRNGTLKADGSPFKLRLRIDAGSAKTAQTETWTYFQLLDAPVLDALETYLEAKRQFAPSTQKSAWKRIDGTDLPTPIVVLPKDIPAAKSSAASAGKDDAGPAPTLPANEDYDSANPSIEDDVAEQDDDADAGQVRPYRALRRGLPNVGNTCYLNSALKLIAMGTSFDRLLDASLQDAELLKDKGARERLQQTLAAVVKDIRRDEKGIAERTLLNNLVRDLKPAGWNHAGQEQDAAEFLSHLMDQLELPERFRIKVHSRLSPLANDRGSSSITTNHATALSIPIAVPQSGAAPVTMQQCIDAYFEPEEVEYGAYASRRAQKQFLLTEVPDAFLCVLNRFSYDEGAAKKMTPVHLERTIRLPRHGGLLQGQPSQWAVMEPWAVIRHHGQSLTASGNHYTMYQRTHDGKWIHHNDATVQEAAEGDIQDNGSITNYVILYLKKEVTDEAPKAAAKPKAAPKEDAPKKDEIMIGKTRLRLIQEDITRQQVDAIVNAANASLTRGAGVCGAIFQATDGDGPGTVAAEIAEKHPRGIQPGHAVITGAGKLSTVRHVIHTVGPDCRIAEENQKRKQLLMNAYQSALRSARQKTLRTVAFPSISTGIFGYPLQEAAGVALDAVATYVKRYPDAFDEVRFTFYDPKDAAGAAGTHKAYQQEMSTNKDKLESVGSRNRHLHIVDRDQPSKTKHLRIKKTDK